MFSSTQNEQIETSYGRLAVRFDAPHGGIPLLLLQRVWGTMDDCNSAFIAAIARHRRVIRFDSAGVGRYRAPYRKPSLDWQPAAEVWAVLGLSHVDVLGWSLGGAIAQEFALNFPPLLRRLTVAGTSPGPVPMDRSSIHGCRTS